MLILSQLRSINTRALSSRGKPKGAPEGFSWWGAKETAKRSSLSCFFLPFDSVIILWMFYNITQQTRQYFGNSYWDICQLFCIISKPSLVWLLFKSFFVFRISYLKLQYHITKLLRKINMLYTLFLTCRNCCTEYIASTLLGPVDATAGKTQSLLW